MCEDCIETAAEVLGKLTFPLIKEFYQIAQQSQSTGDVMIYLSCVKFASAGVSEIAKQSEVE